MSFIEFQLKGNRLVFMHSKCNSYQIRHRSLFPTDFGCGRQLKALLNSSELSSTPFKRIRPGQCVSSNAHFVAIVVCVSHQSFKEIRNIN